MTHEKTPRIDVIMSAFNGSPYVKLAIDSVLDQKGIQLRLFIADDGSTDGTQDVLQAYSKRDSRVTVFRVDHQGLTKNLNVLFSLTDAPYVARMDADDISAPGRLRLQSEYLTDNPDTVLCACGVVRLSQRGIPQSAYIPPDSDKALKSLLKKGINPFAHGSVMMRRHIVSTVPGPYRFRFAQDYDLWMRLRDIGQFGVVQEPLYGLRIWGGSISSQITAMRKRQVSFIRTVNSMKKPRIRFHDVEKAFDHFTTKTVANAAEGSGHDNQVYARARKAALEGRNTRARRLLWLLMSRPPVRLRTRLLWFLCFLPAGILRMSAKAWEFFRDPLARYRLPEKAFRALTTRWGTPSTQCDTASH